MTHATVSTLFHSEPKFCVASGGEKRSEAGTKNGGIQSAPQLLAKSNPRLHDCF